MLYTRDDEETVWICIYSWYVILLRGDCWSIGIITQNGVCADSRAEKKAAAAAVVVANQ